MHFTFTNQYMAKQLQGIHQYFGAERLWELIKRSERHPLTNIDPAISMFPARFQMSGQRRFPGKWVFHVARCFRYYAPPDGPWFILLGDCQSVKVPNFSGSYLNSCNLHSAHSLLLSVWFHSWTKWCWTSTLIMSLVTSRSSVPRSRSNMKIVADFTCDWRLFKSFDYLDFVLFTHKQRI